MSEATCCPLSGHHGDVAKVHRRKVVKAAKDHTCTECHEVIPRGTKYERVEGLWDDTWSTFRTCLSCVEIRSHFACDDASGEGRWVYGEVWTQLEDNFFPDMRAGGPCMQGLSPAAKDRLFTRRMKWLEDSS